MKKKLLVAIALATGALAASAGSAFANTAANTQILNSADLTYNDGTGIKHATSQVVVTVALKPAAPTLTPVASQTGPYPTTLTDSFVLTNNSNGPDTFNLTDATANLVNTTSVTAAPVSGSVTLGATVTVGGSYTAAGTTYLYVAPDGVADNSVNGIKLGSKVVVNGEEKTVSGIQDNVSGFSIIQIPALTAAAPGAGVIVGERVTVQATATPNNITATGVNVTADVTMKAASATDPTVFANSTGPVSNLWYSGSATLVKYVRNLTNPNGGGSDTTKLNGNTYYHTSTPAMTAKPGDVLEYLLLASNTAAAASISNIIVTDLVPTDYVTLQTSVYSGKAFLYYPDASNLATSLTYTSTGGDDAVDYDATNVTGTSGANKGKITAWVGGATPAYNTPGTIPASKSVILLYQVTVNP